MLHKSHTPIVRKVCVGREEEGKKQEINNIGPCCCFGLPLLPWILGMLGVFLELLAEICAWIFGCVFLPSPF